MASNNNVIQGVQYDVDTHLHYTQPKVNDRGSKNVNVLNKAQKSATLVSTPLMLTWGVNEFVDDSTGRKTYDLALQFPSAEYPNPEAQQFLDNMKALETRIKQDAITNCKEWFNKAKMSDDVVDALWTPMLRYPKDKQTQEPDYSRAPTLKVKIPFWNDTWNTEVFDTKGKVLFSSDNDESSGTPVTLIPKGAKVATIIKNGGIWFANGKFGTTWRLEQVVVQPRASLKGTCHIVLKDSDKAEMEKQVTPDGDEAPPGLNNDSNTTVNDSDDETSEAQDQEKPLTPPPAVKKKRVVKKKAAASADDDDE